MAVGDARIPVDTALHVYDTLFLVYHKASQTLMKKTADFCLSQIVEEAHHIQTFGNCQYNGTDAEVMRPKTDAQT